MKLIRDIKSNEVYILDKIQITYLDTQNNYKITSAARSIADLLERFSDADLDNIKSQN